jgi:hypothetical protein
VGLVREIAKGDEDSSQRTEVGKRALELTDLLNSDTPPDPLALDSHDLARPA